MGVDYRKGKGDVLEAEIGVTHPEDEDISQGMWEASRSWKRQGNGFPP